jgi:chromosome segregation ATPase
MNAETEPMTLEQMEARRDELEEQIAALKAKLEQVRARRHTTGEWADPDWYRRATTRLRFTGVEHQRLNRQIAEAKREQRRARATTTDQAFVAVAREMLGLVTFERIMAAARAKTEF